LHRPFGGVAPSQALALWLSFGLVFGVGLLRDLAPEERQRSVILGSWYGVAGAVDYFGPALGLPNAVSGHMTYHL
jgi:hypothetical protein